MKIFRCRACQAPLKIENGCNSSICEYCDTVNYFENKVILHKSVIKRNLIITDITGSNATVIHNNKKLIINIRDIYREYIEETITLDILSKVRLCKALNITIDELQAKVMEKYSELEKPNQTLGEFFYELEQQLKYK